jgi:NitT/TauT family transport system substrate-binding protein
MYTITHEEAVRRRFIWFIAGGLFFLSFAFPFFSAEAQKPSTQTGVIRFGTLPVIQALPLFVARDRGFFGQEGVDVELVGFNSALEKDVAFSAGQIVGYFGDLQTCIVLNGNRAPIRIVAEIFNATKHQRTFALVSGSKYGGRPLAEIAKGGVAVSSNTILDYLTTKFFSAKGVPLSQANLIEVKNIPIRLQMLLGGQVAAAVLPEPLATLAESKGARALADDAGTGFSSTVLAFNEAFLGQSPEKAKAFLRAVQKASAYVNGGTDDVRSIMNKECRIPEELQKTFPIPEFPRLAFPTNAHVTDVYQWLFQKGTVKRDLTYRQMVADGFLP